ncbi:hypothetical protein [Planctomicrobium piriforme]|uniref:VWFA domain-containing protein n=1 Tax=Planctomicrobium piriforme TaxID=1576369 RepID=A0A1I3CCI4_9PLAN|nr:hypothetical protein [Planctomicrobium piriforme]SFH72260.1 hypothetical protein SAMN05421753_102224 [Planctomicrobium piriforme]
MPASVHYFPHSTLLAQAGTEFTTSTLEWDHPFAWWDWLPILLLLAAMGTTLWFGLRDGRTLARPVMLLLLALRLSVLAIALVIAFNPHTRTQTDAYRDSRVILLVDTSQSMQQPETDPRTPQEVRRSRTAAVKQLLADSPLVEKLRADHAVDVYSFSSDVSEPLLRLPSFYQADADSESPSPAKPPSSNTPPPPPAWDEILAPTGMATRLGDSLDTLLVEAKSPTLSGIVVMTDGASNSGRDVQIPRERARQQGTRLVAVGVGSTEPPLNLEIVRLVAPTDVQKGDPFEIAAQLRGTGLAGRSVHVELLQQGPSDPEPTVIFSQDQILADEGTAREVTFELKPSDAGTFDYTVRARIPDGVETREDDNQLSRSVNIFDRSMRVLIIAGGPLRDYRYARTILNRHPSMQTDVWLQSGSVGISQEAKKLLYRFPETVEALYEYDVVIAFDPDWTQLTAEQREMLSNWVANEGGGMVVVAGDVFTPNLAASPDLEGIRRLYPVLLEEVSLRLNNRETAQTAFPLSFTPEGQAAEFLKLSESDGKPVWDDFGGIFLTYPTRGAKAGTTVYAEFSDPLSRGRGGQPIVLAGQRFGQGQVLYIGSPELWRLRSLDAAYLERLWVKLARKAAEGRSKRGLQRGMFILDGREFILGQTVPLRLRALNPQFQPLVSDTITVEAFGPGGAPVVPSPELKKDPIRPAEFTGDFRPLTPGRYRLEFALPDSTERVVTEIEMQLPRQEAASLVQDVALLKRLVEGTTGQYLPIEEAAAMIPQLLPNKGERVIIDQRVKELWDRGWLMGLLVALLSLEWLARKLLKLA